MTAAGCPRCGAVAPLDPGGLCIGCAIRARRGGEWPAPLGEAAYCGVVGAATRAIEPHTEADPAAVLASLLVLAGNALGRTAYLRVEDTRHYPNLYAVLVGESSKARKGTSLDRARALLRDADPGYESERIRGGLSSAEGLVWQVRDPITEQEWDKQAEEWREKPTDPGVADKRLVAVEPEFASVLRVMGRQGNLLSTTLRNLWDCGEHRFMTKGGPKAPTTGTTGAHVSLLAHITSEELRRELRETDRANGFANRFLFICARRSKSLPFGGGDLDLTPHAKELRDALDFARNVAALDWDAEAREKWAAVYPALTDDAGGMFGAVTNRAEAQVTRLAVLYAALDQRDRITRPHLDAALEVWRYAEQSAAYVFGGAVGDRVADGLLGALRAHGGRLDRTQVRDLFGRHGSADRIEIAIDELRAAGRIAVEQEPTGGRPSTVLVLCDESDQSDQRGGDGDFRRFRRFGREGRGA